MLVIITLRISLIALSILRREKENRKDYKQVKRYKSVSGVIQNSKLLLHSGLLPGASIWVGICSELNADEVSNAGGGRKTARGLLY